MYARLAVQVLSKCTRRFQSSAATSLDISTVHKGNLFEERSIMLLQQHLSMSLTKIGGRGDGGIDLQGWWWLPPKSEGDEPHRNKMEDVKSATLSKSEFGRRRIRVLGQCKAERKKMGPKYVRELEGVVHTMIHANAQSEKFPYVGILVSESAFTKSALTRAMSSPIPFLLVHLPPLEEYFENEAKQCGLLGSIVWNSALAGRDGLLGGELELRWERTGPQVDGDSELYLGRPSLWWKGRPLDNYVHSGL